MLRWKRTLPWEERKHGTSKQKYMVVSETDNREYLPTVWKGTVPSDGIWGDHITYGTGKSAFAGSYMRNGRARIASRSRSGGPLPIPLPLSRT